MGALCTMGLGTWGITLARERERSLGPAGTKLQQKPNISALLGLILGSAAPSRDEEGG